MTLSMKFTTYKDTVGTHRVIMFTFKNNGHERYIVDQSNIMNHIYLWTIYGLNQTTLAAAYGNVNDVQFRVKKR